MEQHMGVYRPVVAAAPLVRRLWALRPITEQAGKRHNGNAVVVLVRIEESKVVVLTDGMVHLDRPVVRRYRGRRVIGVVTLGVNATTSRVGRRDIRKDIIGDGAKAVCWE